MEVKLPALLGISETPTERPTNRLIDGQTDKLAHREVSHPTNIFFYS